MLRLIFFTLILSLGLSNGFSASTGFSTVAYGAERVGILDVSEVLLRPALILVEGDGMEFDLQDSRFKVGWRRDRNFSSTLAIGSRSSTNLPQFFSEEAPDRDLGIFEAYAQYEGVYGRFRAGLIPLSFGHDATVSAHDRVFPRPMIYSERLVALRDFGVSFYTSYNGYYTELIAHNGEIDHKPNDGNLWLTSRWGWSNERDFSVQISAQAGSTNKEATENGASGLAGFDSERDAQWRSASFFAAWNSRKWEVVYQSSSGEVEQDSDKGRFVSHQFDLTHYFRPTFGMGLRYDSLDPNTRESGDQETRSSLVLIFQSEDGSSAVHLVGTKRRLEKNDINNDEIRLSWRLTPFVN